MAESVKRRVAAARLAVAFVAAGTIAGATAWAQAGPPPPTAQSSAYDAFYKPNTIKTQNVVNGSLLFQDFKPGEVVSGDAFFKYKKAETAFKKAVNAFKYDAKVDIANVNGDLNTIKGELGSFVKAGDAIMGDGSVLTATKAFAANSLTGLLNVPNLVSVEALAGGGGVQITNVGGNDLTHSACEPPAGGPGSAGTLKPGESLSCATGEHTDVMQLVGGSGVTTLNFSSLPAVQAGARQYIIAILVGM